MKVQAYNIWRNIEPSSRRRLALAVFLMFATIGPLSVLMTNSFDPVRPVQLLILTLASGSISACIVMFARKPLLLVPSLIILMSANLFNVQITDFLVGAPAPGESSAVLKSIEAQLNTIGSQRALVGAMAIALLTSGYIMFIVLLSKEGRQRIRLQAEMAIASGIQQSLLPRSMVALPWCTVAGTTIPAEEVGGDYFDIIELREERLVLVVADVTGHGVGSGILSAMTKSALRSQLNHDVSPIPVLENLNQTIMQVAQRNMFVTMAYALIDNDNRTARIATAGHPPLFIRHGADGTVEQIRTRGVGLGMSRDGKFSEVVVPVNSGDVLLLYTDGVVEAADSRGDQFGSERLQQALARWSGGSLEGLCRGIIGEVQAHGEGEPARDDVTLVAFHFAGTGNLPPTNFKP